MVSWNSPCLPPPEPLIWGAHMHLLTARQKRWSPDPRPEGRKSNEWRPSLFVFLLGKLISRSAARLCKPEQEQENLFLFLLTLLLSAHVATEVAIYHYFPRFGKSHLEDHALFLNVGFLCVSIQMAPCTFLKLPSTYCHPLGHTHCCVSWSFWYSTKPLFLYKILY